MSKEMYSKEEVAILLRAKEIEASKGSITTNKRAKGDNKPKREYPDVVQELLDSKSKAHFIVHLIHLWMAYKKKTRDQVWKSLVSHWRKLNKENATMIEFTNFQDEVFPYVASVTLGDAESVLSIAFNIHNQLSSKVLDSLDLNAEQQFKNVQYDLNSCLIEQLNNEDETVKCEFSATIEKTKGLFSYGTPEWDTLLNQDVSGHFKLTNHKKPEEVTS